MVKVYRVECFIDTDGSVKKNFCLVTKNGKILEKGYRNPTEKEELYIKGTLYPPFVNAHTHLELSSFSFSPDSYADFFSWLLTIIAKRQTFTPSWIESSYNKGLELLKGTGTAYVGDISSFGFSKTKTVDGIKIIAFTEVIGKDKNVKKLIPPLSAHSVYSVSFELLKKVASDSLERGYPFQIHLGETKEEISLVRGLPNKFESLIYPEIGRTKYFMPKSVGLIDYLNRAGVLHENAIAVHCTNLSPRELEYLAEKDVGIVFCPRSNLHLKVGFPQVEAVLGYEKLALGTDGMSSNLSLNVIEELRLLYYKLECRVPIKKLFYLLTEGGAKVLKIPDYGKIALFSRLDFVPSDPLNYLITLPTLKLILL